MPILLGKKKRPISRLDGFQNRVAQQVFNQCLVNAVSHHDEVGIDILREGQQVGACTTVHHVGLHLESVRLTKFGGILELKWLSLVTLLEVH